MTIKNILVVDDEKEVRDILADIFQFEGYEVRTASNGIEAFRVMNEFTPDLIISDIIMPECDGLALFREVARQYLPPIPMIFISGYVGTVVIDELKNKENFVAIFSKPLEIEEILKKIEELKKS